MAQGKVANTQLMYKTNYHEHLDTLLQWACNEFPTSSIDLVRCEDGRWFIEVDFGRDFDRIEGISKPDIAPYAPPQFFDSEEAARRFAITAIKRVHPELLGEDLEAYFSSRDQYTTWH